MTGIYGGAQNYYTHKFCNLDNYCGFCLRDNLEVVRDQNGTYAPDLYADRIERIVSEHNKSKVRPVIFKTIPCLNSTY